MRISPLALTIILALLTGVAVVSVWALLAEHFNPPGTPDMELNSSEAGPADSVEGLPFYTTSPCTQSGIHP